MQINDKYLDIDGKKISVNIRDGHNGDVLLIHGLGCSKESFDELLNGEWLKDRRLIAPDLPGFGKSSGPQEYSYTMEAHAKCLSGLLAKLKVTNPVIIAHSMGGAIALLLIEQLPSVEYFFCLEGNLIAEDCTISKAVESQAEDDFIISYNVDPVKYRWGQHAPGPKGFYRSSVSLVQLSESGELLKRYNGLKYPKTYIYGDKIRNTKAVRVLALAGQDVVGIEGCGHFMLNEKPDSTYSVIEEMLKANIEAYPFKKK